MNDTEVDPKKCAIELARQSCVVCQNYRAVHPVTKASYCQDGSKTVHKDSGCSSFSPHRGLM